MKLVFIENDRPLTDSLIIAEKFEKEHKNVTRDISNQIEKLIEAGMNEFVLLNFERTSYKDSLNREQLKFLLTEDAFAIVVMSYVTVEAMKFKTDFLLEFNRMRTELLYQKFPLPKTFSESLRLLAAQIEETETVRAEKQQLAIENTAQKQQLKEQETPIAIYNLAIAAHNTISMLECAKSLGTGRTRLYDILREEGIVMKNSTIPYQRFIDAGYFKVTERPRASGGTIINDPATRVTAKGFDYIARMMQKRANPGA